jgi:regulator of protease activity HflC (stomatin/prohibitin superfamily)
VKNELQKLLNESEITLQESARQQAAKILADGEHEAVTIKKEAKNRILSQKAELIGEMEGGAKAVLFISQQLPNLYKAYQEYAGKIGVDNYVVLDEHDGFNKAVNRGPKAFADFIREFEGITGIRVADYLNAGGSN